MSRDAALTFRCDTELPRDAWRLIPFGERPVGFLREPTALFGTIGSLEVGARLRHLGDIRERVIGGFRDALNRPRIEKDKDALR